MQKFTEYSYLWQEDPVESFDKFLVDNEPMEDPFLKTDE